MRWDKKFDGTKESLRDKSHRPHTKHPNAHTDEELKWIQDYHRRNPYISVCELYGKLHSAKGYSRHPGSLYLIYRKLSYSSSAPSTKTRRRPQPYDTSTWLGIKWQMDVKYVPAACHSGSIPQKFSQYTVIDEAFRERFYNHISFYNSNDLLVQMKRYLNRSNNIPMQILGWKSPLEKAPWTGNLTICIRWYIYSIISFFKWKTWCHIIDSCTILFFLYKWLPAMTHLKQIWHIALIWSFPNTPFYMHHILFQHKYHLYFWNVIRQCKSQKKSTSSFLDQRLHFIMPLFFCKISKMLRSDIPHKCTGFILFRMMILETTLLLTSFWFLISVIISAPHSAAA